ncbi:MAG: hypothetical protein OXC14_06670 [Rhodospirillaceae bacterium]|nr:hypothetical protein [Rhodospirillaceae bacterium]
MAARYRKFPDVIPMFLDACADMEARDEFGFTPLHTAAKRKRLTWRGLSGGGKAE